MFTEPSAATTYDEVVYPSFPVFYASLDHIATTAYIFGIQPPPIDKCRVLELGTADGGNIVSLAQANSDSTFLGIDLSSRQIEMGQQLLKTIGMTNVELRTASITDVTPEWGQFDYILCHGVYSWVPPEVRDKIMAICRENLSPNGLAYISYNTYPGWHMKRMVREMMVFHASRFASSTDKVRQSRALLDFLLKSAQGAQNDAYTSMLKGAVEAISTQPDYYLLHEFLEDINEPLYFYQFVQFAAAKKLQYLGETHVALMSPTIFPTEVEQILRRISPDIIHMEQYIDFLRNRAFRQTVLCHEGIQLNRNLTGVLVQGGYLSAQLKAQSEVDLRTEAGIQFTSESGMTVTSTDRLTKAALLLLSDGFPNFIAFEEVMERAAALVGISPTAEERARLADNLLRLYTSNLVYMRRRPQTWAATVPQKPRATALARDQAANRRPVSSLAHNVPTLSLVEYALLPLLDGTRDHAALAEAVRRLVQEGVLNIEGAPDPRTSPAAYDTVLYAVVQQGLKSLREARLILKD